MKKLDFLPNRLNKYSIRKFTVGTASILIGSLVFLGHDAKAAEDETASDPATEEATSVDASNEETPNEKSTSADALNEETPNE
ncbi:YSIRK-type signal peptide-containing protein, partial [Nosocomiicoccus sp. HMSC067E10]|uniref:YSIRK-type signal peptide-containing protein n=1 Tax=Nosocomiicoccus sp. HMSC067E10 TaxID=1739271 RepID=UPI000AC0B006